MPTQHIVQAIRASQGVDGSANLITAAICKVTSGQPASVCATPLITGLQGKL